MSMESIKDGKVETERILKVAPTYVPTSVAGSIIGAGRLNFRVRNGAGCDPPASSTTEREKHTWVCLSLPERA